MNIRVVDSRDVTLAEGRDLLAIRRKLFGPRAGTGSGSGASGSAPRGPGSNGAGAGIAARESAVELHRQWDFGALPESVEVQRNRLRLVVYPAVEDRVAGVAVVEARSAADAAAISRGGLVRLSMLSLPQQAKYVAKRMADDRDLVLLSRGLPMTGSVAESVTRRAFRECFLPEDVPLPRSQQVFASLLDARRSQLNEVADRLSGVVTSVLREWRAVRTALEAIRPTAYPDAIADINQQLRSLLPESFIETTPRPWLDYLPRYLKAIARRVERLPSAAKRDAELSGKVKPFVSSLQALVAQSTRRYASP